MSTRRSISVDGFGHGAQPIPAASRVGPLVVTGGVYGLDRSSGAIPDDAREQVRLMFENLAAIMVGAGGSLDGIVRMTIYASSSEIRDLVNEFWVKSFPDPQSRPARHTQQKNDLPANMAVQCDAIAWFGE